MGSNTTDFEEQVRIGINSSEIVSNLKTVEKSVRGVNSAFQSVSAQVDAVIKHIENLTVAAANAGTTVNKTFNNANTYTTNQNITRVTASGKNKQTIKAGDTVMAFDKTDRSSAATNARQEGVKALKKQNDLLDEQIRKAKELTKVEEKRAKLLGERAKNYSRDSESKAKNAEANLLNAQTKSKYPFLFGTGANNRNWRYQSGRMLQNIGNTASSFGTGGRLAGYALDSAGALLKAPAMGTALAVSNLVKAIADLGKEAVKAYSEIESIKTQLGVVFSNQTQADSMFGEISQYAVKSPFGVQQTSELAVLLKQSGVYATDLMDTLKMIGDTAGGNMEKMKRIANNYAQIVSIGKASMLDMRQFAYAGIPIFEAVSKELGVSQQELRKLISDGKVTADIIEKVFKDLTGINGIFENATEKGAKTLKARLQNLSDARQLAFSQIGQGIVGLGTQTGNDSYANRMVSWAEDLYSKLNDWFGRGNIAADVATIARRNDRIKQLEDLIAINKGNEEALKYLQAALDRELAKIDVDAQRATYEASYNEKKTKHDEVRNIFGDLSLKDAKNRLYNMQDWYSTDYFSRSYLKDDERYKNFSMLDNAALQEQISLLKEFIKALKDEKEITVEELQAHRESNVINAQQLAFDQANKSAGKQGSYTAGFEKLYSLYTSGDKYKLEQQKKETEWLEDSKKVLKELLEYKDSNGNIDITKMTFEKLNEYLDEEKRVLDAGRKLTVVEGKSQDTMTADRAVLTEQYKDIYTKVEEELRKQGGTEALVARNELGRINRNINYDADNKTFFREFSHVLDDELSIFDSLIKNAKTDKDQEFYKNLRKTLLASTFQYEAPSEGGLLADLTDKGKGNEFIPLWKRIVASDTGWSAERITTAKEFMKEYQKYSAQQIARGGIQGLAMAGGRAGEIGTMLSYTGTINKQGVHQVDWQKTQENIYKYALALETPLKKASATMKGLSDAMQNQVEVYRKLSADIYTTGEDWATINADIKGQYSVAQGLGNANILDNAFEAMAANSDKFKISFDDEKGLVVFDKMSNQIVGSIEELKNSNEISDSSLKDFLKDIHVDNLVSALDKASEEIENQAAVVQINSEMLLEANKLAQERATENAKAVGESALVIGALKNRNVAGADSLSARNNNSVGYLAGTKINQSFASILSKIAELSLQEIKEDKLKFGKEHNTSALLSLQNVLEKGTDISNLKEALEFFIMNFPDATKRIVEEATKTAENIKANEVMTLADNALRNSPLSIADALRNKSGNNNIEKTIMSSLGSPDTSFARFSKDMTASAIANPSENTLLIDKYIENIFKELDKTDESEERIQGLKEEIESFASTGSWKSIESELQKIGDGEIWQKATDGANKWALSLGNIGQSISGITDKLADMGVNFMGDAITSTFQTWGECLGKGEDASKAIAENLKSLAASTMQNMGAMLTQAGLSLAVSSWGDKGGVMAGLAIAAAGGSLSFLGGYLSGVGKDDNKEDKEYEKLLKIKQDLADLLKQAREDAIYYENTTRHKKAISANDELTQRNVHDAIITPRGEVVNTDPRDYLIATKTPRTLVGGGAPTINFNVVDKSTGIRVTQQSSTYNEETNTIEFEAIIESKVQEIIASPKGDEAFSAREARLRGRTVNA